MENNRLPPAVMTIIGSTTEMNLSWTVMRGLTKVNVIKSNTPTINIISPVDSFIFTTSTKDNFKIHCLIILSI